MEDEDEHVMSQHGTLQRLRMKFGRPDAGPVVIVKKDGIQITVGKSSLNWPKEEGNLARTI